MPDELFFPQPELTGDAKVVRKLLTRSERWERLTLHKAPPIVLVNEGHLISRACLEWLKTHPEVETAGGDYRASVKDKLLLWLIAHL